MKWKMSDLGSEVEKLLKNSGFSPELYEIKEGHDSVAILFDKKEAVDYFRIDFELSYLAQDCIYEYKKISKKHAAYIYSW